MIQPKMNLMHVIISFGWEYYMNLLKIEKLKESLNTSVEDIRILHKELKLITHSDSLYQKVKQYKDDDSLFWYRRISFLNELIEKDTQILYELIEARRTNKTLIKVYDLQVDKLDELEKMTFWQRVKYYWNKGEIK